MSIYSLLAVLVIASFVSMYVIVRSKPSVPTLISIIVFACANFGTVLITAKLGILQ